MQIRITNDTNFYGNTNLFSTLTTQINFEENSFNRGKLSLMQKSKG